MFSMRNNQLQDRSMIEEAIDFALRFAGYDEYDQTLPSAYVWNGEGWGVFSNDVMTGFFETEDAARTAAAPGEVIQEATGWYIVKGECPMPEPQSSACKPDTPEGSGSLHRIVRRRPSEWEQITGIKILDPDGWRDGTRWETPLTEREWKKRMQKSTRSYTPNSRDDGGPEASSTSSETLAAFVDEAAARAECEKINQANRPTPTIVILPRGVKFNGFDDLGDGRGTERLFKVFVSFDGEEFTGRGWGETSYGRLQSKRGKRRRKAKNMKYRVQDTTTSDASSFEVKADGEARPRNDGTEPMRYATLEQADAAAKNFRGMSAVEDYEGV
jgi:hypothetical protein